MARNARDCRDAGGCRVDEGSLVCVLHTGMIRLRHETGMNRAATKDRHKAPALPPLVPLSLQDSGPLVAFSLPALIVKIHQDAGAACGLVLPDSADKIHQSESVSHLLSF